MSPLVTLLSDIGSADGFPATIITGILKRLPDATFVDNACLNLPGPSSGSDAPRVHVRYIDHFADRVTVTLRVEA